MTRSQLLKETCLSEHVGHNLGEQKANLMITAWCLEGAVHHKPVTEAAVVKAMRSAGALRNLTRVSAKRWGVCRSASKQQTAVYVSSPET